MIEYRIFFISFENDNKQQNKNVKRWVTYSCEKTQSDDQRVVQKVRDSRDETCDAGREATPDDDCEDGENDEAEEEDFDDITATA